MERNIYASKKIKDERPSDPFDFPKRRIFVEIGGDAIWKIVGAVQLSDLFPRVSPLNLIDASSLSGATQKNNSSSL